MVLLKHNGGLAVMVSEETFDEHALQSKKASRALNEYS